MTLDDLKPAAIPTMITAANRGALATLGTAVTTRKTVYLARPEADATWIQGDPDVLVRPGEAIAFDPATGLASRVTAEELAAYDLPAVTETVLPTEPAVTT